MRIHSLDALRAVMMVLGLVLHTALAYIPDLEPGAWAYQDPQSSPVFSWLVSLIHAFRMPVFFAVAGFFGAFLVARRGTRAFLRHRLDRIGIPFVAGWIVLFPLTLAAWVFAGSRSAAPPVIPGSAGGDMVLIHLWFLYHLLILCAVAALVRAGFARLPSAGAARLAKTVRNALGRRWMFLGLVAVTAQMLIPLGAWELETDGSLLPPVRLLAAYGTFFAFGWLEHGRGGAFDRLRDGCLLRLAGGVVVHALYLVTAAPYAGTPAAIASGHQPAMVLLAASMWLFTLGFLGLFRRWLDAPNPAGRYLSDASYWMYLVHLPFAVALPPLLAGWGAPAVVKFVLALGALAAITLATYHYGVRATWVGKRLNGRRYPRTFPWQIPAAR